MTFEPGQREELRAEVPSSSPRPRTPPCATSWWPPTWAWPSTWPGASPIGANPSTTWSRWPRSDCSRRWAASTRAARSSSPPTPPTPSSVSSNVISATGGGPSAPPDGCRSCTSGWARWWPPSARSWAGPRPSPSWRPRSRSPRRRSSRRWRPGRPTGSPPSTPRTGDGEGETLLSRLGTDDPELTGAEQRATLSPLLDTLPQREQTILHLRFFEGLTQSEIATRLGISQMHVSRLLGRSVAQLRAAAESTS